MKTLILALVLFCAAGTASAQTDSSMSKSNAKYWYYPSQNYYYNESNGEYWYYNTPSTKWEMGKQLPATYKVTDKDTRYQITSTGTDVWKDNKTHATKFKANTNMDKAAPATNQQAPATNQQAPAQQQTAPTPKN